MTRIAIGTAALALLGMLLAWAPSAQAQMDRLDHFTCYPVADFSAKWPDAVELKDQFGSGAAKVSRPIMLCNPVDKNGEGIINHEAHLVCFEIRPDLPRPPTVLTGNQWGEQKLALEPARMLCLPSKKEIVR